MLSASCLVCFYIPFRRKEHFVYFYSIHPGHQSIKMFGFIKNLFRNTNTESTAEGNSIEDIPEEHKPAEEDHSLDYLWELVKEEKYDDVINAAAIVLKEKNTLEKQHEALRLKGLSHFHKHEFGLAEEAYTLLSETSANPDDWFNLSTASTMNRNIEHGERANAKAIELHAAYGTAENLPVPHIIYYYMLSLRDIQAYKKAFTQLNRLKDIYCDLQITDSTFLYIRGIPFFETAIESSKSILENIDDDAARSFLAGLKSKVDENGKEYLESFEKSLHYKN